jgi:Holliday junction resolvase RusA-like endonuclease
MTLTFTVIDKPIPLPRSRSAAGKRPYVSAKHPVQAWKSAVWLACYQEIVRRAWPRPCFTGPVSMSCIVYGAHGGADLDNIFKSIADSLNSLAYADDAQIARLTIERRKSDKANPPGAYIEIEEIV